MDKNLGATIEEGLHFRHKPYIYLYSPEEGEGLNLIRGDHKGRSKTFQYMQNSDVQSIPIIYVRTSSHNEQSL